MSSPFRKTLPWTNPIVRPSRSTPTTSIAIPRVVGGALTEGTTTDTANGAISFSAAGLVPGSALWLISFLQVHLKHTVASASVRVSIELYNGPTISDTPAFTIWGAEPNLSPTAGDWALVSMAPLIYFAPSSWTPGQRLLQVRCTPLTAGTLTIGNSAVTAFDEFDTFVFGGIS